MLISPIKLRVLFALPRNGRPVQCLLKEYYEPPYSKMCNYDSVPDSTSAVTTETAEFDPEVQARREFFFNNYDRRAQTSWHQYYVRYWGSSELALLKLQQARSLASPAVRLPYAPANTMTRAARREYFQLFYPQPPVRRERLT